MIRVLIASASAVVRAGLESLLGGSGSVSVVRSAGDLAALSEEVEAAEPDVVVLEVGPGEEPPLPLPLAPDALARTPAVVLLVDAPDVAAAGGALRSGVRAILPRTAGEAEILAAVEAAAAGLISLSTEVVEALLALLPAPAARPLAGTPSPALTPREAEVLAMLAEGLGNKGIARRLGISDHTVKAHVASILGKLRVSTRTEAVAVGARLGLILL